MSVQLVIPMSGIGSRFISAGYSLPKPLIEVAGKTIIEHVISMFPGVEDVLFIVNKDHLSEPKNRIEAVLKTICPTAKIFPVDPHKLGPGWAIFQAKEFIKLDSKIIVNYCDFYCTWDFQDFLEKIDSDVEGVIATYSGFHPHMLRNSKYAYVKRNLTQYIEDIQEKTPYTSNPMAEEASSGTYAFQSGELLLNALKSQIQNEERFNGEFYISLTYKDIITRGLRVDTFQIDQFLQWGTPEDLQDFENWRHFFQYVNEASRSAPIVDRIGVLAAGAGVRFQKMGYSIPKPFLPLFDSLLCFEAVRSITFDTRNASILLQLTNKNEADFETQARALGVNLSYTNGPTAGQASSAKMLLENFGEHNCIIGSCDSLLFPGNQDFSQLRGKYMAVWATTASEFAKSHPMQFGWVRHDELGKLVDAKIKSEPNEAFEWKVITGSFYFGNANLAQELIREFEKTGNKINDEYYLDSLLMFAKVHGWEVSVLTPEYFVSLGTPDEYETVRYWEKFFNHNDEFLAR